MLQLLFGAILKQLAAGSVVRRVSQDVQHITCEITMKSLIK